MAPGFNLDATQSSKKANEINEQPRKIRRQLFKSSVGDADRPWSRVAGSAPPYLMVALFWFDSIGKLQAAVEAHALEVFTDIPHFTNVSPVVQISEIEE